MTKFIWSPLILAGAIILPKASAALSFPSSPAGFNESVNWAQMGAEFASIPQNFSAVSSLGASVSGGLAGSEGLVAVVQPIGTSWLPQPSGYSNGESLVWAEDLQGNGSGPITISFPARQGAGAYIQSVYPGMYIAMVEAFNGGLSLGAQTLNSNASGDPLFLGAVSDSPNITRMVFSVLAVNPAPIVFAPDPTDFSMGTFRMIPESSTVAAGAGVLVLLICGAVKRNGLK